MVHTIYEQIVVDEPGELRTRPTDKEIPLIGPDPDISTTEIANMRLHRVKTPFVSRNIVLSFPVFVHAVEFLGRRILDTPEKYCLLLGGQGRKNHGLNEFRSCLGRDDFGVIECEDSQCEI